MRRFCGTHILVVSFASAVMLASPLAAIDSDPARVLTQLAFEENIGQLPSEVLYLSRGDFHIRANGFTVSPEQARLDFVGANPAAILTTATPLPGVVNSLEGNNSSDWVLGARRFGSVRVSNVYPGISLEYRREESDIVLSWSLAPGSDPSAIQMQGPDQLVVVGLDQRLWFRSPSQLPRTVLPPRAFQSGFAVSRELTVAWRDDGLGRIGFDVADYNPAQWLRVDVRIAAHGPGNAVRHESGAYFGTQAGPDLVWQAGPLMNQNAVADGICGMGLHPIVCGSANVSKLDASGKLIYSTYFGGGGDDTGVIGVDGAGDVWIAGTTDSTDFPITSDALQSTLKGPPSEFPTLFPTGGKGGDFFVSKIDGNTGLLVYSTYLGREGPRGIGDLGLRVDHEGNALVVGKGVTGLPVTAGALSSQDCGDAGDGCSFVARWDQQANLRYLTYFPGIVTRTAAAGDGALIVGGHTVDGTPISPEAKVFGSLSDRDAFVGRVDPTGSSLDYSMAWGELSIDQLGQMVLDSDQNIWFDVESYTSSPQYNGHATLVQLDAAGGAVLQQFEIGARAQQLTLDDNDNVYVVRFGKSASFSNCGLTAVSKIDGAGNIVDFAPRERVLIAGFDSEANPVLRTNDGSLEVVQIEDEPQEWIGCSKNAASFGGQDILAPGEIVTLFGRGMGPEVGVGFVLDDGRVPFEVGGTRVFFNETAGPVLYAQDGQVNAIVPFSLVPDGYVTIRVEYGGREIELEATAVSSQAALFARFDQTSQEVVAAAINQDGTINGPDNPARAGEVISLFATGAGVTSPGLVAGEWATGSGSPPKQTFDIGYKDVRPGNRPRGVLAVEYIGTSPGSVTSLVQINARLIGMTELAEITPSGPLWVHLETEDDRLTPFRLIYVCSTACPQ